MRVLDIIYKLHCLLILGLLELLYILVNLHILSMLLLLVMFLHLPSLKEFFHLMKVHLLLIAFLAALPHLILSFNLRLG